MSLSLEEEHVWEASYVHNDVLDMGTLGLEVILVFFVGNQIDFVENSIAPLVFANNLFDYSP